MLAFRVYYEIITGQSNINYGKTVIVFCGIQSEAKNIVLRFCSLRTTTDCRLGVQ